MKGLMNNDSYDVSWNNCNNDNKRQNQEARDTPKEIRELQRV